MSLTDVIGEYLDSLRREASSTHTIRNYESDLRQFESFCTPEDASARALSEIDLLTLRQWVSHLYEQDRMAASIRRKVAAIRALFRFAMRRGLAASNPAKLLILPKMPKTLPKVPTAEEMNGLVDAVADGKVERPFPKRDRAIFEFLYGCGLRVSELAGLNLADVDVRERWIRVLGKGRKERLVPFGAKAAEALSAWLPDRHAIAGETALFVNYRGKRLTTRGIHNIVVIYARLLTGNAGVHPHTMRHAYATHLLSDGADLRAIQELLGHARLSTTQKYTQVALSDLMAVYDKAHPKAK
jgi:integrase/recombinase XerC